MNGFVVEFSVTEQGRVRVENVDNSIERFFSLTRAEFIADWTLVLKHIDSKYHAAIRTVLSRPEAFPNRESLVFSTARRSGVEPQYFQLTLQREAKAPGVSMYAVCLDVSDLVLAKEQAVRARARAGAARRRGGRQPTGERQFEPTVRRADVPWPRQRVIHR